MFPGISNSFGIDGRERGVPEVTAGILIYMTMKSLILFMINYHKPEVQHEIASHFTSDLKMEASLRG